MEVYCKIGKFNCCQKIWKYLENDIKIIFLLIFIIKVLNL